MSRMRDIIRDLAELKDTIENFVLTDPMPVMLLPRNLYNAMWDGLHAEGFMTHEHWATRRGEDFLVFSFTMRLMPDKVGE